MNGLKPDVGATLTMFAQFVLVRVKPPTFPDCATETLCAALEPVARNDNELGVTATAPAVGLGLGEGVAVAVGVGDGFAEAVGVGVGEGVAVPVGVGDGPPTPTTMLLGTGAGEELPPLHAAVAESAIAINVILRIERT